MARMGLVVRNDLADGGHDHALRDETPSSSGGIVSASFVVGVRRTEAGEPSDVERLIVVI